jgi:hypothetical protein
VLVHASAEFIYKMPGQDRNILRPGIVKSPHIYPSLRNRYILAKSVVLKI